MWRIAEGASQSGQGLYFISDTDTGKLLNDGRIWNKTLEICDDNYDLRDLTYGNPINGVRSAYVVDNHLALCDRISSNLAKSAS